MYSTHLKATVKSDKMLIKLFKLLNSTGISIKYKLFSATLTLSAKKENCGKMGKSHLETLFNYII